MTEAGPPPTTAQLDAIVHDFNNLLCIIAASAAAARERAAHDPALLAELGDIEAAAERGAALVRKVLGLGGQATPPAPRAMDLNAALRSLTPMLRRILGTDIALELEDTLPLAWVDPAGFDQAVLNLAANARDAMPAGGRFTLCTKHRDGRAVVEASDTGEGIAPDLLPRVLQPGVTTKGAGHGIGLASVSATVQQSGGRVTIESVLGEGTTVRLHFPAAPEAQRPGRKLVLLVEDEAPVRNLAARMLTRRGWEVLAVDSAESAIAVAEARLADLMLVVADFSLPGLDGAALIRDLRARRPSLPAILTSGYPAAVIAPDESQLRTLAKPYDLESLAQACAEAVERS